MGWSTARLSGGRRMSTGRSSAASHPQEQRPSALRDNEQQQIDEAYRTVALGRSLDSVIAIDRYGIIRARNSAAGPLLGIRNAQRAPQTPPDLSLLVQTFLNRAGKFSEPEEYEIFYPGAGQKLKSIVSPVVYDGLTVGVVAVVPERQTSPRAESPAGGASAVQGPRTGRSGGAFYGLDDLLGRSIAIRETLRMASLVAAADLPVLIVGESGTGKEIIAQSIHNVSPRAGNPFIAVNCGAIPYELSEAEFFGYETGAFTGAKRGGNAGRFEQADGGTIFLDEVCELSPRAQVSLLRTLQDIEVVRLGSSVARRFDVRVVAATNRGPRQEVARGRFRQDLFYRLNVLTIEVPPLRHRREDVSMLAEAFLASIKQRRAMSFSREAMELLEAYDWPGNVRELKSVVQRLAILAGDREIHPEDLPAEIMLGGQSRPASSPAEALRRRHMLLSERDHALNVLNQCSGNVTEAARRLGVSRMTIYRRIRNWQISLAGPRER